MNRIPHKTNATGKCSPSGRTSGRGPARHAFYMHVPNGRLLIALAMILAWILALPAGAQNDASPSQTPDTPRQVKPLPVPTGVIPLPKGPPPTGIQSPVPSPVQSLPRADRPLIVSPPISAIQAYVDNRVLTMRDAVSIALYTNRAFALAEAQLLQARGRTGQARALTGVQAGVNTELTYFDAATTADLAAFGGGGGGAGGGGNGGGAPQSFVITPQFNPTITSSVTLPLDVTGVLHAAANQAQFAEVAARIDVNKVRNQVVYDVKTAFYNTLRAQAQLLVATDNLNNAIARLNDANRQYAAGTAPRFDVISAQRDLAVAQQGLIDARAQVSLAMAALRNGMGIDIRSRFSITDAGAVEYPPGVAPPPATSPFAPPGAPPAGMPPNPVPAQAAPPGNETPMKVPPVNPEEAAPPTPAGTVPPIQRPGTGVVDDPLDLGPEFNGLLDEALRTRPEVLEGDAQVAAAQRGVAYARRSSLPSLSLSLSDIYSPNAAGFTRRNVGAATLGISIPILDAGLARSRVQEARGVVAAAEINRRTAVDQTQVDVQQAFVTLSQARARVAVANAGVVQALEAARLARVRYTTGVSQQPGVSPQLELSNAQTTLAQAQSNQVNALYDYNNARAQLDRAIGRYGFTGKAPGYPAVPSPATRGAGH